MTYQARITRLGINHPVQQWAKDRSVKPGTLMPAPCPVADKPGGKKGKPVPYGDKELKELFALNGFNEHVFEFIRRIGGWLFNSVSNKHLIGKLKGLLPKWLGKIADSYVPYPLPKGKKAFAEKIYCDGNLVVVDQERGRWAHLKPGYGYLTQVRIGSNVYMDSNVRWKVPAGWIEKSRLEKIA